MTPTELRELAAIAADFPGDPKPLLQAAAAIERLTAALEEYAKSNIYGARAREVLGIGENKTATEIRNIKARTFEQS